MDEEKIIDKASVKEGDVIVGLPSSGIHSNGFSLIRKVFDIEHADLSAYEDRLGKSLGETLLTPTVIYVKPVLKLLEEVQVHSLAHITGGGFYENLPRAFGENLNACIRKGSWQMPPIFPLIQEVGEIPEHDMYNTFNMGIGMCAIVAPEDAEKAVKVLNDNGIKASIIGTITSGSHDVVFQEDN